MTPSDSGFAALVGADRHTIETITPTGHRHRSRAPAPPGHTTSGIQLERLTLTIPDLPRRIGAT